MKVPDSYRVFNMEKTIEQLREENQRYKQTLDFYADRNNYQIFVRNGRSNIEHDGGKKARQALEGEE